MTDVETLSAAPTPVSRSGNSVMSTTTLWSLMNEDEGSACRCVNAASEEARNDLTSSEM